MFNKNKNHYIRKHKNTKKILKHEKYTKNIILLKKLINIFFKNFIKNKQMFFTSMVRKSCVKV